MRYGNVAIRAMGYALPAEVVTSADLESRFAPTLRRLGFPAGTLEHMTGVKERRYWEAGVMPSQVAAAAASRALESAGIAAENVDVLVSGSVTRDYIEPATAALVGGLLGVPERCACFDVSNACLGFLNGLTTVANLIELGQAETGLVVVGEQVRDLVGGTVDRLARPDATLDDFRLGLASLTLGSGAAAAVVTRADLGKGGHRLVGGVIRMRTRYSQLCLASEDHMVTDSPALLSHGVDLAMATYEAFAAEIGWKPDSVQELVGHQVSVPHHTQVAKALGFGLERAGMTLPWLGNTGPASIPITLAVSEEQGRVQPGMRVVLFGVGSGLGCIILGVEW